MPVVELIRLLGQTAAAAVLRFDFLLIIGVVLLMVYTQYQRAAMLEQRLFGFVRNRPGEQLVQSVLDGILGGAIATVVFVVMGVSLNEVGIWYLWGLALLLMLVQPRFMCFSYGAGILALSHLILGVPSIDVPALMALVAVLHLVEAVLILLSGARSASPLYVRSGRGDVVGAFSLQKFWPLPFIALIGAAVPVEILQGVPAVDMPDWWPIIRPSQPAPPGMEYAFALFPVVAALGYGDVAVTRAPAVKARQTSARLLLYSAGLLALAVLSQHGWVWAFLAALYSPLVHEWVIQTARRSELEGEPKFAGRETMVLDVHPDSPAARGGVQPGDIILAVNGIRVATRQDLADAMTPWAFDVKVEVENGLTGERRTLLCPGKVPPLGVLLVPGADGGLYLDLRERPRWQRLLDRWARFWSTRSLRR